MRPASAFFLGAGLSSIVGAASGAAVYFALKSELQVDATTSAETAGTVAAATQADPCEQQAWPHFDRRCLAHKADTAARAPRYVGTDNVNPAKRDETAAAPAPPLPIDPPASPVAPVARTLSSPPNDAAPPRPEVAATQPARDARSAGAAPREPPRPATTQTPTVPQDQARSAPPAEEPAAAKPRRMERKARKRQREPRDDDAPATQTDSSTLPEVEAERDAMERRGELPRRASRDRDGSDEGRRRGREGRGPIVRRWVETLPGDEDDAPTASSGRRVIIMQPQAGVDDGDWRLMR